ncbi:IML2-like protein [Rhizoctonia solani AG-1 IA]|uniref:IML2-like protein n=1 Tax=Thanatephorus cucumeris (strain AG1-IA) TaxID=983506 RepID=L8WPL3_THACA|nr:IML2-like protein [Rhizoctonia solani AG-1 IA]
MEEDLMPGAVKSLTDAEAGSKAAAKATRLAKGNAPSKYPIGMEHEICQADATVLLGLTQALSESYMGYLQCIAHGKFSKMYKQVFPHGLGSYGTPAQTPSVSRKPSTANVAVSVPVSGTQTPASGTSSAASSIVNGKTGASTPVIPVSKPSGGFLSRLTSKVTQSTPSLTPGPSDNGVLVPEGPIEELIVAGAAFVVGFLGYQSDRRLGLEALHVAAGVENDVHSTICRICPRVAKLGLQAKLERMTGNPDKAIEILREGLSPSRAMKFQQADALEGRKLIYIIGVMLLIRISPLVSNVRVLQRDLRYISIVGCYLSIAKNKPEYKAKARSLLDSIPKLLERKKIGGKDLPTEVFIQKKIDFYKRKHVRRAGPGTENDYIDSIAISPAEVWNTHCRITPTIAQAHIENLVVLSPPVITGSTSVPAAENPELDTVDELVVRDLLLGILYRAAGDYTLSRKYLEAVPLRENEVEGKWTAQVAKFELAVLDLRQVAHEPTSARDKWQAALKAANGHLDQAAARSNANVDLSSRLDSRIMLLCSHLGGGDRGEKRSRIDFVTCYPGHPFTLDSLTLSFFLSLRHASRCAISRLSLIVLSITTTAR